MGDDVQKCLSNLVDKKIFDTGFFDRQTSSVFLLYRLFVFFGERDRKLGWL